MKTSPRMRTLLVAGAVLAVVATLVGVGLLASPSQAQARPAVRPEAQPRPEAQLQARPDAPAQPAVRLARPERLNQTPPPPPPGPPPGPRPPRRPDQGGDPGQRFQEMQQRREAFLNSLAAHLGLTRDQLGEAMKQARIDQIKQAVADGRLDQERANRIIQAIQSGQGFARPGGPGGPGADSQPGGPPPGPGGPRRGGPPGGPGEMRGGGMLAASVLGLSPEQLRTQFEAGKSLAQIAQDKDISRDDLKAKLIAAQKARLDQAVASGRMTADQAQQVSARFAANVDRMIDFTPGQRRGPDGAPQSD